MSSAVTNLPASEIPCPPEAATDKGVQARIAWEYGDVRQALELAKAALAEDAASFEALMVMGELTLAQGNAAVAQKISDLVHRLRPADRRARQFARRVVVRRSIEALGAASPQAGLRHILLYTDDPALGGVAQYNHALLLALAAHGHRVACMQSYSDSPLAREQREHGVRHHWIDYDTGRDFARTLSDYTHATRVFRRERPDLIVFSDCCPFSNMAARHVAMQLGIPFIVVVNFVDGDLAAQFPSALAMMKPQHAAAQAVIAVSEENLRLLRERYGTPPGHSRVITYGRPARFFAPRDAAVRRRLRAEIGLPDDAVVSLTTARLTPIKGFRHQLEAIRRLRAGPGLGPLHFIWAGDGEQRASLEEEIARDGLEDRVHLIGHRWDVADWYDAADFFVLPSHCEGMPLSIMEAMAKGLPVAASAVSGIPEQLDDTGCLLPDPKLDPERTVAALVDVLARWSSDPGQRDGAAARARAVRLFREELMTRRMLDLLEAILASPVAPGHHLGSTRS